MESPILDAQIPHFVFLETHHFKVTNPRYVIYPLKEIPYDSDPYIMARYPPSIPFNSIRPHLRCVVVHLDGPLA